MVLIFCIPCYIKPVHLMKSFVRILMSVLFLSLLLNYYVKSWFITLVLYTPYKMNLESKDHLFLIPLAQTYLNWILAFSSCSKLKFVSKTIETQSWLVWLNWLRVIQYTERSLVSFPIRAHIHDSGLIPGWFVYGRQPTDGSL